MVSLYRPVTVDLVYVDGEEEEEVRVEVAWKLEDYGADFTKI